MSHRQFVNLASWSNHPGTIWSIRLQYEHSNSYQLPFGTSLANVGQLGADNNCVRHAHTVIASFIYAYIYRDSLLILLSFNGHFKD